MTKETENERIEAYLERYEESVMAGFPKPNLADYVDKKRIEDVVYALASRRDDTYSAQAALYETLDIVAKSKEGKAVCKEFDLSTEELADEMELFVKDMLDFLEQTYQNVPGIEAEVESVSDEELDDSSEIAEEIGYLWREDTLFEDIVDFAARKSREGEAIGKLIKNDEVFEAIIENKRDQLQDELLDEVREAVEAEKEARGIESGPGM
jgi:DNA integrity scanning protein DisA with diadenylate cyclase activity